MAVSKPAILAFLAIILASPVLAADPPADPVRAAENKQIQAAAKPGPAAITLRDQAVLHLPPGYVFVPQKESAILLRRMGNFPNDRLMGLVFPKGGTENWFVVAEFDDSGYIKDDDGKNIDAGGLLQKLKDATEEENKLRHEKGEKDLHITGWIEPPHYDQANHHLVWSIALQEQDDKGKVTGSNVNYNTYALGRGGYVTLNLVTSRQTVDNDKAHVRTLLSDLTFNQGKRYEDFNIKTDRVAEFGLLALVGGLAVKKLGLLALAIAFLAKSAKVIAVAFFAGLAGIKRFFGRGKKPSDQAGVPASPAAPPPPGGDLRSG